jgi:hypothetical protein
MIPKSLSDEANQDSEPNITVNPANPLEMAASAFTPDPMGGSNAPIYVSTDGGNTWFLNSILPGAGSFLGTFDITLRFGGTSNNLYLSILKAPAFLDLNVLRTNSFASSLVPTLLESRGNVDQPFIQATTVASGTDAGKDRIYIGMNDFNAGSQTATIDQCLDATIASPAFSSIRIETRSTGSAGQDGPQVRVAVSQDGTIYGIFSAWRVFTGSSATVDIVVVRDDNWGIGTNPFTALVDSNDNLPGIRVATGITVPWLMPGLGQERIGGDLSIVTDPTNSSNVYIVWADQQPTTGYTLHLRKSNDRGVTWPATDLRTIFNAKNPALAINSKGKIGFLYQQLTGTGANQRWDTHIEMTTDDFATVKDVLLATLPADNPTSIFLPYLGDYDHLVSVGKNFYGIFSSSNIPDNTNFPQGVVYQRNANFNTHTLLGLDGTTPAAVSIDPFFFKVTETTDELQVIATTRDGRRLWHTIRHANGSWDHWDDVEAQAGNKGPFEDVECATVNDELQVIATTEDGRRLWHTIRHANGSWDHWDDVEAQAGNKGPFKKLAIG